MKIVLIHRDRGKNVRLLLVSEKRKNLLIGLMQLSLRFYSFVQAILDIQLETSFE